MKQFFNGSFYKTDTDEIVYIYFVDENIIRCYKEDDSFYTLNKNDVLNWEKTDLIDFKNPTKYATLPKFFEDKYNVNNLSDFLYIINNNKNNNVIKDINNILDSFKDDNLWKCYHKEYIFEEILEALYENDIDFEGKINIDFEDI